MTDLSEVLPDFDLTPYRHLTHSLEKHNVSVSELISLDPIEIARRCPLPLGDLKSMIQDIVKTIQKDLGFFARDKSTSSDLLAKSEREHGNVGPVGGRQHAGRSIKTLDATIDECLGGGILPGHLTEIVGESAVGKTQFVLGLLLSVQLAEPQGLGKSAIYISTEAQLSTRRLRQMLETHPLYERLSEDDRPTTDRVHAMSTNDLEKQEHIIRYQLPLAVQRFDAGLVVLDSVAANFRAEHETKNVKGLADRAVDLTRLGVMLRAIAMEHDVAVVVTNQVSDRFDDARTTLDKIRSSSSFAGSSPRGAPLALPSSDPLAQDDCTTLDFQQRFFTGWGDHPSSFFEQLKTPALGLTWSNQLSARIVLRMESDRVGQHPQDYLGGNIWKDKKKRRFVGVVFAPWVCQTLQLVEYEITSQGPISVSERAAADDGEGAHPDALDPSLWLDGVADDEEFP